MKDLKGDGLLIHHWDTDGICSAALLLRHMEPRRLTNWTPDIGSFYLTDRHIEWAQGFDYIIIADMALPEKDIRRLSEAANVHILDHHQQSPIDGVHHINPVARGAAEDDYPSCTWVIKEALGLPVSLYVVLGFIGDREHKIKDNERFWGIIEAYTLENGTSFEELLELVSLIDSSYRVCDRRGVEEAPTVLNGYTSPEDIRGNSQWRGNLRIFDEKVEEMLLEPPEEIEGVLIKHIDTEYAVISAVTRRIAWSTGRDTIVVNKGFFPAHDQLYSRSQTVNLEQMKNRAIELGFISGGKKDVIGVKIPKHDTESFICDLLRYFKSQKMNENS